MNIKAIFDAIIRKLNFGIKREMARKGAEATNVLRNVEIEVLSKPGSGKKYKALPNRSSSPGETPAPQSGRLRQEWEDETIIGENRVTSRLRTSLAYAEYLENGTGKMAKRPFVDPIKKKAEPEVVKIFGSDFEVTL